MAVDASAKGTALPPITMLMETGRLAFFASAIGEIDPIYTDLDAARAAGHPGLPVPPTFLFSIELEQPDPFAWLTEMGVDLRRILHGEQSFTYHAMAFSGDTLVATPQITDVYSKKAGTLEFIVKHTQITRDDGGPIADLDSTIVVRNPTPEAEAKP